jgi:diguanylate cyclase (GGDEF)-like protein
MTGRQAPRGETSSTLMGPPIDVRGTTGPARPIAEADRFVEVVLAMLERSGAGRWRLAELHLDELASSAAGIVPIEVREGAVSCVLQSVPGDDTEIPSADAMALAHLAGRILATRLDLAERRDHLARRADRAERLALADVLTDLPNRRGWWDAVRREAARCTREDRTALIAVVDLDDLKTVNDSDGHLAGDLLLVQAARSLRSALRAGDLVGRVGGDEFAVFAVSGEDRSITVVVSRLREALEAAGIRASIGYATVDPGVDTTDRYSEADRAMYEEKARRKGSGTPPST